MVVIAIGLGVISGGVILVSCFAIARYSFLNSGDEFEDYPPYWAERPENDAEKDE